LDPAVPKVAAARRGTAARAARPRRSGTRGL